MKINVRDFTKSHVKFNAGLYIVIYSLVYIYIDSLRLNDPLIPNS